MRKLISLFLGLILVNLAVYSSEVPDYHIFLDAKFRCDSTALTKIPWSRGASYWKMAYKTVSILSDVQLSEEVRVQKKSIGRHRDYKLQYIPYARIICGEKSEIEESPKLTVELPVIIEKSKRPGYFDIYDNDEIHHEITYLYYMKYTDQPNPPGMDGLACLVDLKVFLADPIKSVNLKKLCKNEKKSKIDFTKKEILRVAEILKKKASLRQ